LYFSSDEKTGGCISGEKIILIGKIFSPGQYNLEINFRFRNTGKKKGESPIGNSPKNYTRASLAVPVAQAASEQ
jgi:hypothetical protein